MSLSPRQKQVARRLQSARIDTPADRKILGTVMKYIAWPLVRLKGLMDKYPVTAGLIAVVLAALLMSFILFGCATGRTAQGGTVVGVELGEATPETMAELVAFGGAFLPPPWNLIATSVGSILLGGTAATVRAQKKAKEREDAAWDEAAARTAERYAPPPSQA